MFQLLPVDSAPGHPSPGTAREQAALARTHREAPVEREGEEGIRGNDRMYVMFKVKGM